CSDHYTLINLKFLVKLNKAAECFGTLSGEHCMSRARVFEWYKRFSEGREDVQDDECSVCLCTSKTSENIQQTKIKDRRSEKHQWHQVSSTVNKISIDCRINNQQPARGTEEVSQQDLLKVSSDSQWYHNVRAVVLILWLQRQL
uniref:Mos1 transposase HTH domain-containing protein n=1 Tax=Lates calcarifer TaxID=8187 RepID=A0A4W6BWH6_LATCA